MLNQLESKTPVNNDGILPTPLQELLIFDVGGRKQAFSVLIYFSEPFFLHSEVQISGQ